MTPNKQPSLVAEQTPDSEPIRQPSFLKKLGNSMLNIYHRTVDFVKEKSVKVAAVGALSTVALTGCSSEPAPSPEVTHVAEQPGTEQPDSEQTGGETQAPEQEQELSMEEQINALKIEAGLSPEAYAKVLLEERWPAWNLAGAEEAWELLQYETDATKREQVREQIAEEQKNVYANALFVPGWEQNLSILADQQASSNAITLLDWLKTKGRGGVLWEVGMVVERVEVVEEDTEAGTRKLYVAGYETNNGAETTQADSPNTSHNGAPWDFYITTTIIDGVEYVSDWSS